MVGKILPANEHSVERVMRVVVGLVAISLVWWGPQSFWGLLGFIPLVTGLVGSCPLYTLLGVSTCKVRPKMTTS